MSLAQLCVATDKSPHTVTSYELGRRQPPLDVLVDIAAALGTTVVGLLTGVPPFDQPR